MSISLKTAFRNIFRNTRRSILTALGIGVGCMIATTMTGLMEGQGDMFLTAAAEGGAGHLKVVPAAWPDMRENSLRLVNGRDELETLRSTEGVVVAAPRARIEATLGFGTRIVGLEMVGVDPAVEQRAFRPVRNVAEGRYLQREDSGVVVLGRTAVNRLDVELGDEIFVTVVDSRGEMESALLELVGTTETGSDEIDVAICHVNLPDAERLWGAQGAGEIAVVLEDTSLTDAYAVKLRETLSGSNAVLTWAEVSPDLKATAEMKVKYVSSITGVLLIVVFLGVASAQLAAVLERRREFAVLVALGTKSLQMASLVVYEALALGVAGAVIGLALGFPIVWYMATKGIDLSIFLEGQIVTGGVLFDAVLYSPMGIWVLTDTLFIAFGSTILGSIYPAWYAVRTDPAEALRVAG
jgi:ABC-type lipoprotein release transport system permease subunit